MPDPLSIPSMRRDLILLTAICTFLWCGSMWGWPIRGTDETRYTGVARELLGRSNWLVLTWRGEPYDEKPPLAFWMMGGLMKITGMDNAWLLRLPTFLAALATTLLTYTIARRFISAPAGLTSALLLATAPLYSNQAVTARLDMISTAYMTLALGLWLGARASNSMSWGARAAFWASLAAAFFTRNALMPALLLLIILIDCARAHSLRPWRITAPAIGLTALAAFIAAWFYTQHKLYPAGVVKNQWQEQIVDRLEGSTRHGKPFWYYPIALAEGWGPWVVLLAWAAIDAIAGWLYEKRQRSTSNSESSLNVERWTLDVGRSTLMPSPWPPLVTWVLLPLLILSLVGAKRPQYLLPLYPAIAILIAHFFDTRLASNSFTLFSRRFNLQQLAYLVLTLALLAHAAYFYAYLPGAASGEDQSISASEPQPTAIETPIARRFDALML